MVYQGKRRFAGVLPRLASIAAVTQARCNLTHPGLIQITSTQAASLYFPDGSIMLSRESMSFHIVFIKSKQRRVSAPFPAPFSPHGDLSSTAKDSEPGKCHEDLGDYNGPSKST